MEVGERGVGKARRILQVERLWVPTYGYHNDGGQWYRAYGTENWEFDQAGLMARRIASINDRPIEEKDRKFRWPPGRWPDDHPATSGRLRTTTRPARGHEPCARRSRSLASTPRASR